MKQIIKIGIIMFKKYRYPSEVCIEFFKPTDTIELVIEYTVRFDDYINDSVISVFKI